MDKVNLACLNCRRQTGQHLCWGRQWGSTSFLFLSPNKTCLKGRDLILLDTLYDIDSRHLPDELPGCGGVPGPALPRQAVLLYDLLNITKVRFSNDYSIFSLTCIRRAHITMSLLLTYRTHLYCDVLCCTVYKCTVPVCCSRR